MGEIKPINEFLEILLSDLVIDGAIDLEVVLLHLNGSVEIPRDKGVPKSNEENQSQSYPNEGGSLGCPNVADQSEHFQACSFNKRGCDLRRVALELLSGADLKGISRLIMLVGTALGLAHLI